MSINFNKTESELRALFCKVDSFLFKGERYAIKVVGKPSPSSGECKTDLYILAEDTTGRAEELKISIKQENADFLENKIRLERAKEIFGESYARILSTSIESTKNAFEETPIIYFDDNNPQRNKITLGWKFEIMNKLSGKKSGKLLLTDKQKKEVYTGINLSIDKRNSKMNGVVYENSGVANYILQVDGKIDKRVDFYINELQPIDEFIKGKELYFACKALNYRIAANKWDGNRPLVVYVNWFLKDGKIYGELVYNEPLRVRGDEIGNKTKNLLATVGINKNNFSALDQYLHKSVSKKRF